MRIEDLVVLVYTSNECYTNVISYKESQLKPSYKIVIENDKWIWIPNSDTKISSTIGTKRTIYRGNGWSKNEAGHSGIIGVYDKTDVEHLNRMVRDSQEATQSD
jgi:hypothetical protein